MVGKCTNHPKSNLKPLYTLQVTLRDVLGVFPEEEVAMPVRFELVVFTQDEVLGQVTHHFSVEGETILVAQESAKIILAIIEKRGWKVTKHQVLGLSD